MARFLKLPPEIFDMVLAYLLLDELGKLDMAILNHSLRSHYLSTINLGMTTIEKYEAPFWFEDIENQLLWIVSRNVIPLDIFYDVFHPAFLSLILNSRSKLRSLELCPSESIPAEYLSLIGPCPSLKKLKLFQCDDISHTSLKNFLALNPTLEKIVLFSRVRLSPDYITSIAFNCRSLKHLDLSNNIWFNDRCLTELTQGTLNLTSLNISSTDIRSDPSVHLALKSFPNLRSLLLHECSVSSDVIKLCLRQVVLPALTSDDPEIQSLGLDSLLDNIQMVTSPLLPHLD
jgi:hypothetical protein